VKQSCGHSISIDEVAPSNTHGYKDALGKDLRYKSTRDGELVPSAS
jgi:hypothetical protein